MITIIVPVYNASAYLPGFLDSLLEQTFQQFELILVDGGSTDDSVTILQHYQPQFQHLRFISEQDQGIYDAMNKGVELASSAWLYFMGADDSFYGNDTLQLVVQELTAERDIVYGNITWQPENIVEAGEVTLQKLLHQNVNHQRIFYRKTLFNKFGGYNIQYKVAADYELNIRMFCNEAITKQYVNCLIANYHSGGFSAAKTDEQFWKDWNKVIYEPFRPHLETKLIYSSLAAYCRYLIANGRYGAAAVVAGKVCLNSFNFGFVALMVKYVLKRNKK